MRKRSGQKITRELQAYILKTALDRRIPWANLFHRSSRAGHFVICNWLDFHYCFRCSSAFRLGFLQVAVDRLARVFLDLPALCKRSHRSPCSRCLSLFPFLESASAQPLLPFFFTGCCRSFATLPAVCRISRDRCANPPWRWDSAQ